MRTTINIDDHLLAEARELALRNRQTLGRIVEDALRERLSRQGDKPSRPVGLPTFSGKGLQPGVDLDDSAALLDLMATGATKGVR